MAVVIRPITLADVVPLESVRVSEEQYKARLVAPNPITIAQARFETGAYDFCIWDAETRVGLLALIDMSEHEDRHDIDDPEAIYIWRLLIGSEFQGKGYGTAAMALAEDWARSRGKTLMQIQAVEANAAAISLYEKLGYVRTGQRSGVEIQLEKRL